VIGLTIVAPDIPSGSLYLSGGHAAGGADIAIGNVVGSNIYNILMIIGVSSMVTPDGLRVAPSLLNFDMEVHAGRRRRLSARLLYGL